MLTGEFIPDNSKIISKTLCHILKLFVLSLTFSALCQSAHTKQSHDFSLIPSSFDTNRCIYPSPFPSPTSTHTSSNNNHLHPQSLSPCRCLDKTSSPSGESNPSTGPSPPPLLVRFSTNRFTPSDSNDIKTKLEHSKCIAYNSFLIDNKKQQSSKSKKLDSFNSIPLQKRRTMPPPSLKNHQRLFSGLSFTGSASPSISPSPSSSSSSTNLNSPQSRALIEPIVYQFTLYYPGNIPLVITAGHGGSTFPSKQTSRKMTHNFKRVPNIMTTSSIIDISSFSEPVSSKNSNSNDTEDTMPWMPLRNQSLGGNFKADLNTHTMALNLANAISSLTNREFNGYSNKGQRQDGEKNHSEGCQAQGKEDQEQPEIFTQFHSSSSSSSSSTTSPLSSAPSPNITPYSRLRSRAIPNSTISPDGSSRKSLNFLSCNFPHVIVFRVPRKYVDVNRNITGENAIPDHPVSEAAWREYHDLIDHVQKMALQNMQQEPRQDGQTKQRGVKSQQTTFNQQKKTNSPASGALLLDIHGHAHSTNLVEIGYLFNETVLSLDDDQLNSNAAMLAKDSSIRALLSRVVQLDSPSPSSINQTKNNNEDNKKLSLATLIRGRNESMGGLLQEQGIKAIPSPDNNAPCQGCVYFFGGYTIQRHGSRDQYTNSTSSPSFDAIQLELPRTLRIVTKDKGHEIGFKLGRAIVEFVTKYYGIFQETFNSTTFITNTESSKETADNQSDDVIVSSLSPSPSATAATVIKSAVKQSFEENEHGSGPILQSNKNSRMPPPQYRHHSRQHRDQSKKTRNVNHNHSGDSDSDDEASIHHHHHRKDRKSSRL